MSTHRRQNTQNPIHAAGRAGSSVRHSKEDALSDMEFELLMEGARTLSRSEYYYEPDPTFIVYTLGRLGLRRGELAHLTEEWIDWRQKMIRIPSHQPCSKGIDGEVCGYCQQLAKQRVEIADELTMDEALEWMWTPKTEAAAREVYFGFDARAELFIERYFASDEYNRVEVGSNALNRRVKRAAEEAERLGPADVSPHTLRATAATYHASRGLEMLPLMQLMGWAQPSTSEVYIGRNGTNTARQLDAIHST
ncbi:site-specific integrase [Halobellus rubicundus]|uniref:Site-specific integrase n=1 Tax=Halobellus rubicundus TaxID=2996466 RepID=A0ABD5MHJ4_9EURY